MSLNLVTIDNAPANPIPVTGSLTATVDTTGLAAAAKQDTGNTSLSSIDGKLPAVGALSDATANPTVSKIQTFGAVFGGSTWDRIRGGLTAVQAAATGLLNSIGMAVYNTSAPTPTNGQVVPLQCDSTGALKITHGLGATDSVAIGTLTDTSPAGASTIAAGAATLTGLSAYENLTVFADITGGSGGTLNVFVQTSWDGGTTWTDWIAFPQASAGAALATYKAHGALTGLVTTVGKALTPALAAGNVAGGYWGNMARLVYMTGSGNSAGATQTVVFYGSRLKV